MQPWSQPGGRRGTKAASFFVHFDLIDFYPRMFWPWNSKDLAAHFWGFRRLQPQDPIERLIHSTVSILFVRLYSSRCGLSLWPREANLDSGICPSLLSTLLGNSVMSSHYRGVESLKQLYCTLEPSRGPVYGRAIALDCISLRRGACVRSGATIVWNINIGNAHPDVWCQHSFQLSEFSTAQPKEDTADLKLFFCLVTRWWSN